MKIRRFETLAATAVATCCLALAIHAATRPAADEPAAVALAPAAALASEAPVAVAQPQQRPRIEVVFVLDTTGSMSGLIDGAKQKIWAIANRLASGQPRPELRLGLVAYRDLGGAFVTRRFDFTGDMDALYAELLTHEAGGGGDHPEHVGRGLHDALTQMSWTRDQGALRLIFLVGDAPPHDDYQEQGTGVAEVTALARSRGILINTIQCGANTDTEKAWRGIAAAAGGEYSAIEQNGGVVAVSTPYDKALWELNNELTGTVLSWGSAAAKHSSQNKLGNRAAMSISAGAEAASYSAKTARMNDEDLLSALDGGKRLADIPVAELPDELQALAPAEQERRVEALRVRREDLNKQIRALSGQRDTFLRDAERVAGVDQGFDGKVLNTLRRQAAEVGVAYE